MPVRSGKFGVINGQTALRDWSINDVSSPKKTVHSASRGGPQRFPGIIDFTGAFNCYGAQPVIMPGETFTFTGYTAPTNNERGGAGPVRQGPAIVENVVINWNFEAADVLSHAVAFAANGEELEETSAAYTDTADPELNNAIGLAMTVDGEEVENIVSMALTISAENKTYVNSSTNGCTGRESGNIDATLAIVVQNTTPSDFVVDKGDSAELKLFVNDTEFWWLKWMILKDFTGLQVQPESGNIVQFTANFELNGITDDGRGKIVKPDGDVFWTAVNA